MELLHLEQQINFTYGQTEYSWPWPETADSCDSVVVPFRFRRRPAGILSEHLIEIVQIVISDFIWDFVYFHIGIKKQLFCFFHPDLV